MARKIWVFGSNTEGRHGKGDALTAITYFGAIYGQAAGLQGDSWGIITKNIRKGDPKAGTRSVSLSWIQIQVHAMLWVASTTMKDDTFDVQPIGCGLAGFFPFEIAPMFKDAPPNVVLPEVFSKLLNQAA